MSGAGSGAVEDERYNGFLTVAFDTTYPCSRFMDILTERGYSFGVRIVKPTRRRRLKFLVLIYGR